MANRRCLIWAAPAIGALVLAGCGPKTPVATSAQDPTASVAPAGQPPAPPVAAMAPLAPPEGTEAVDQAVAALQAFNARTAAEQAEIVRTEARIRTLASNIASAVSGGLTEQQRRPLSANAQAARGEVERLHEALGARVAAFRLEATTATQQAEAAVAQCAANATLGAYPGCATLQALQPPLAAAIAGVVRRHEAAETAYRQDRARLEEASAVIALGGDGVGLR